jgi:hypothetical protein
VTARTDVLLWAQRVVGMRTAPPHQVLQLRPDASADDAQAAFHKLARSAHPDLLRHVLKPDELELVTQAYSIAAGAYQAFRSQPGLTGRSKPPSVSPVAAGGAPPLRQTAPEPAEPAGPPVDPEQAMSSRALVYYRKAELALRRGDLKGAILQLKLACATDSQSTFLRKALAEVETEVRKAP